MLVTSSAVSSAGPPTPAAPAKPATDTRVRLDKLEPPLRRRYAAWRGHHGAGDVARAKATIERWACKDATFDASRGVSRCADTPQPNDEELEELEVARLVADPHVSVELWLESADAARSLEHDGFHLWPGNDTTSKIEPIGDGKHQPRIYEVHIIKLDLHAMDRLLVEPGVIVVRLRLPRSLEARDEPLGE
ncbi:MAG TPA: hypothetical protein VMJ10_32730 [Kofleriaceae bacterium]|nr:hypothetical protein [Kofleriaceae bacterium]